MIRIQYLIVVLAAFMVVQTPAVLGSSAVEASNEKKSETIEFLRAQKRMLAKPPKKHSSSSSGSDDTGSSGSGSSGSSGSGGSSGSSGGSGSSGSGGSSGSSGSGGSSGSSGSGGSSSGSSGSSNSVSSSSQSSVNAASASDFSNGTMSKTQKSLIAMLSVAAVAGILIAAVTIPRRRTAEVDNHPLKGSLNKRIGLFGNLAKHTASTNRPPRRDEDGRYINADSIV